MQKFRRTALQMLERAHTCSCDMVTRTGSGRRCASLGRRETENVYANNRRSRAARRCGCWSWAATGYAT